jgi:antitoxin component of MazEF toxin-antitoxin module
MIQQKLRKVGNSYVVTIPKSEVERKGLRAGQLVAVDVQPLSVRPVLPPDVQEALEASWQQNEAIYRALGAN